MLYLYSMPGRYEPIGEFIKRAQELEIETLVCLTAEEEVKEKSPEYARMVEDESLPFFRNVFPIPDFGTPEDADDLYEFAILLVGRLMDGENMLIHCAGGIGRTGMFAGCILKAQELPLSILEESGSYPETEEQMDVIKRMPF